VMTAEMGEDVHLDGKKPRKSRKGIKAGPHRKIFIDEEFCLLPVRGRAPNDREHRRVYVKCACGDSGRCRFDELYHSIAKSCGCLEDAAFQAIFGGLAARMDRSKKTAVFADIMSGMGNFAIAEKHGIQRYVVGFIRRQEFGRLERLPLALREKICEVAQANYAEAIRLSGMTRAEVQALCIVDKQQIAASKTADADDADEQRVAQLEAEFEVRAAWNAMTEDQQIDTEEIVYRANEQMMDVIESANNTRRGPYRGELTHAQFSMSRKHSHFRWIYDAVIRIPKDVAEELFGDHVGKFVELVRYTMRRRYARQRTIVDGIRDGLTPSRKVVAMAKRGVVWEPTQTTGEVVTMMTTLGQYRFAA